MQVDQNMGCVLVTSVCYCRKLLGNECEECRYYCSSIF